MFDRYVPYAEGRVLTKETINYILEDIRTDYDFYNKQKNTLNDRKALINKANNSIEEKVEAYCEIDHMIGDIQQDIDESEAAKHFFIVVLSMVDNFEYNDEGSTLLAGIEWNPEQEVEDNEKV